MATAPRTGVRHLLSSIGLVLVLAGQDASAHARLARSLPSSGDTLEAAPQHLVLTFDSAVERRFARFLLELPDGTVRPIPRPEGSGSTKEVMLPVEGLPAGEYRLTWSVVSRDGHRISGSLRFTVRSDGPSDHED